MGALEVAAEHSRDRQALARSTAAAVRTMWRRVDRDNIARSWSAALPVVLVVLERAQGMAAARADSYLDALGEAFGVDAAGDRLRPGMLAGVASDGRDLAGLMFRPAVSALGTIARGGTPAQGMAAGLFTADLLTRTQVADAGRAADVAALVARRTMTGYVRVLSLPSCSRCVILAGRRYRWNSGFNRHPRCDCVHLAVPSASAADDLITRPRAYFDSLTAAEQDRVFTAAGAQAIRDGADPAKVVNARRGIQTAADGRLYTTEAAGRRPRLMPEQILREARGDRTEAVRLLRLHGYIT